jgi:hypothetical protein
MMVSPAGARAAEARLVRPFPVPLRPVRSPGERCALSLLQREGAMPFGALAERVARHLYADELRHGGWAAEIGLVGWALCLPDAGRDIEAADGALWQIEPSAGATPAATVSDHS